MCFYDQHLHSCGDTCWGSRREFCANYRFPTKICERKLALDTLPSDKLCDICEQISNKWQKIRAFQDSILELHAENEDWGDKGREAMNWTLEQALDRSILKLQKEIVGLIPKRVGPWPMSNKRIAAYEINQREEEEAAEEGLRIVVKNWSMVRELDDEKDLFLAVLLNEEIRGLREELNRALRNLYDKESIGAGSSIRIELKATGLCREGYGKIIGV